MSFNKIPSNFKKTDKSNVTDLHKALDKLNLSVAESEKKAGKIEASTKNAIKKFQKENKLKADGELNEKTVAAMNAALHDNFVTASKPRTKKLHSLLKTLNLDVKKEETTKRETGSSTRKAIEEFQKKNKLTADGRLTEDVFNKLQESAIKQKLKTANQQGLLQAKLLKVNKIAGLNLEISKAELDDRKIGATSKKVIEGFQKKYNLPVTGTIDRLTLHKLDSVAASQGTFVKKIGAPKATELDAIKKPLRLNKVSPEVNNAQNALAFLGYKISEKEFNTQTFGKTTRNAVLQFQKSKGLAESGNLEKAEMKELNAVIMQASPDVSTPQEKYRIRGSVRDKLWKRESGKVVKIYEKFIDGESDEPLATMRNQANGFFDVTYTPPTNEIDGQVKPKFHLVVKLCDTDDKVIDTQTHYNVNQIHWVNFTAGDSTYLGDSDFAVTSDVLQKAIGDKAIKDLHETEDEKQVTALALETGLSADDIMRVILSNLVSVSINKPNPLSAEVFYAFIRQNLPPALPGDLLRATNEWETIDQLVEIASSGIVFTGDSLQAETIDNALAQNLVSRKVEQNRDAILLELQNLRSTFVLEKPILTGNQNLETLLDNSAISEQDYAVVADVFIANKGINTSFWTELNAKAPELGEEEIADFTTTVELGNITKNHISTVQFFKDKIASDDETFKSASSFAKLDTGELVDLINENGGEVPENTPGDTDEERVANYAVTLKARTETLFPAVSLAAEVRRSDTDKLSSPAAVESFLEENPDLNFRQQNIDKYLLDNEIAVDDALRQDLKVVQRVHKISSNSTAGAALVDDGLHGSMAIYFAGKSRLGKLFAAKEVKDSDKLARNVYESAKTRYLQILGRLIEFRGETNVATPAAIIPQTYSAAEIAEATGDIPNLETLFGSMDYCDCEHCKSLYSPAAYFTDILRFIDQHDSLEAGSTVKDILFQRRPDLGNIKLNCVNTNTPMPYIDLVCEILENYVAPVQADFSYQTTLTAAELKAIPEYIRTSAYETLATADFPMNSSFNLFQEEARIYLNYLRSPRFELMETFQDTSDAAAKVPDDVAIAAEYFGISSYEKNLIITPEQDDPDAELDTYWGFDTTLTEVAVTTMLHRLKLDYYELIELLLVRFVNEPDAAQSEIVRPVDSCNTDDQIVNNLTIQRFDLMHRFTRLWRKTGWKMWELDLLIRNPKIGNDSIDGDTIVNLKRFKQLQKKLNLPFETLLAFYDEINREVRIQPDKPDVLINPLYKNLFQNIAVTNPIDTHFKAVEDNGDLVDIAAGIALGVNVAPFADYTPVPTILSTLALNQTDFDLLAVNTDGFLSVDTLSILLRYAYLARGLKLSVKDLLMLLSVTNVADPFADLETTAECVENLEFIKKSKFSLLELDYILNYAPDSSVGLREETLAQLIEILRGILDEVERKVEELNALATFDADALAPLTDDEFIIAFTPFQNNAVALKDNLISEDFTAEDSNFLLSYSEAQITPASRTQLIDTIKELQDNIDIILTTLEEQKENQIKSHIASSFNLTDSQATILLDNVTLAGADLLAILEDETLIEKNADETFALEINRTNFPDLFNVYSLLHKVALIVARLNMSDDEIEWFTTNNAEVHTLDFSALPVDAAVTPDFTGWLNLFEFFDFKRNFPEPEDASIRSILDLAKDDASTKAEIFAEIALLTQWSETDLAAIDAGFQLEHVAGDLDYTEAETYFRLKKCFDQMKLTGVDAATMFGWALIDDDLEHDKTVAVQTRQAVKSKYEQDDWLQKITPLHDQLREKKRVALVEYHMENSQRNEPETILIDGVTAPNPLYWKDSIALYKWFLIDVEMSACQLTSRIKQAISSVQLFVQRCFLNLENRYVQVTEEEKEDVASDNAWSQWKWMKNYRIWEANRKIFFYPENWLEPELRDDKSPFFEELENEILQNDVTKDNVEAAFLNYLHKVDEVSHLEVCGLYHELENLTGDETEYEVNIVHVIGRTKALPNIYYYRNYDMNYGTWSAWEKIEVEIQGDQVVPVVYNRKLHLFWLQFIEKPMKVRKVPAAKESTSSTPADAPEPPLVIEIQLGWTIKNTGGWSPKKISKQKLIHPWGRPHYSYNLKPYYLSKYNELYMDIYLSTSKEFNDGKFYDPYAPPENNPVYLTKNRFNETYLPWHSSSFVFNGDIKSIELKALNGTYHLEPNVTATVSTTSYNYVHTNFDSQGNVISLLDPIEFGPRLKLPTGMHFDATRLTNNRVHTINPTQLRVLENTSTVTLLNAAAPPFEMVITQQDLQLNMTTADHPVFYQDNRRAFFVKPEWEAILDNYSQVTSYNRKYRFLPFYHPYTMLFIREFNRDGIDGLLNRKIQISPQTFPPTNTFNFSTYSPTSSTIVDETAQTDSVDFSLGGAYSGYNWEMFFHAPLMIACRLMQNQKFEDAMNWFHYIFDPTNIEDLPTPQRYWITKPFYEYNSDDYRAQRIENILAEINSPEYSEQVTAWKNDPFNPHLIARYRPVAYQKNVVMKYLDNLIAWGDMLFGRDTIESINEASLLYMLAYEILGDRPIKVPNVQHEELTFNEIETMLDDFGNATVDVIVEDTLLPVTVVPTTSGAAPIPKIETLYFCIPNNDYLVKYWDTVEDRLFKIRHCMNIQGIVRQLPLFEPPIDPAMLVKAAAAGIDLSSVLNDLAAPTPYYRFRFVVQKAVDFCSEVKVLGEKLLNALEKKDVEELNLLRSQQEIQLLEAVKEIRKKQIDEAEEAIQSLNKSMASAIEKESYYSTVPRTNTWEDVGAGLHIAGIISETAGTIANIFGAGISMVPDFDAGGSGFGGSPVVKVKYGGTNFGNAASKTAEFLQGLSSILHASGSLSEAQGGYTRREEENKFQARLAAIEKEQIQFQINMAEIRQTIAEKELENQELQIENAKATDDYMRGKYTNQQLYSWMITQISTVYFQSYQLAFEMAKKAEKCFLYELGLTESNYIQFGYWDSLKKGLLSGDKLVNDLRRLESAYLDQNKREFEITKHVSLAQMFPLSLITLKETGKCTITLPEWLFDMDYPGHYMRRIKNISVSIPCIVGPYTGVNCTLSLLKNETRVSPTISDEDNYPKVDENDTRFRTMFGSISSIATSHAQNDSGMFELNFNDERYLPFEGAGIISDWQIDMPIENNYFDFSSLSDVILHISYTSRNGGGLLTTGANKDVQAKLPDATARLFDLKHDFSTEWYKFLNPEAGGDQELIITLKPEHFPFFVRGKLNTMKVKNVQLFLETEVEDEFRASIKVTTGSYIEDLPVSAAVSLTTAPPEPFPNALGELRLKLKLGTALDFKSLTAEQIDDLYLLLELGV